MVFTRPLEDRNRNALFGALGQLVRETDAPRGEEIGVFSRAACRSGPCYSLLGTGYTGLDGRRHLRSMLLDLACVPRKHTRGCNRHGASELQQWEVCLANHPFPETQ